MLASCVLMLSASGCASVHGPKGSGPSQEQAADVLPEIPSPADRIAALRQLAREANRKDADEIRQISAALAESIRKEEDPLIRAEIVRTLAACPSEASDAVLRAALSDPEVEVRVVACEAWGGRGDAEAARLLSEVLGGDLDTDVRLAAARALGQSSSPVAVAALGQALEDKDPALQYCSVLSLRKVTGKDFGNDVSQWRRYVAGELPESAGSPSLAERLRRMLTF